MDKQKQMKFSAVDISENKIFMYMTKGFDADESADFIEKILCSLNKEDEINESDIPY